MTDSHKNLIEAALAARKNAHCPYSGYAVGAAVTDERGLTHIGCNVENASFPEGCCAETSAIAAMVAAGGRRIDSIAIVGGKKSSGRSSSKSSSIDELDNCTPCGGCRQRIAEFADDDTRIILVTPEGDAMNYSVRSMKELLPDVFSSNKLR